MNPYFLVLAPAFGGTRFGPFQAGSVGFGSDGGQCAIVLPASMGIHAVHAWLTPQDASTWVLQPAAAGAGVFVFQGGGGVPAPITSASSLRAGDAFALGHAQGPRFMVEGGGVSSSQTIQAASGVGGRRPPTAAQMGQEVKRQASTYAMSRGPFAPLAHLFYRAQSGALLQPRYIVGALVAIGLAAITACGGVLTVLSQYF